MLLGLGNAAQTLQRFIDQVLRGLDFVYEYIDDLLIASSSESEQYHQLQLLSASLSEYEIVIQLSQCEFSVSSLDFHGHQISADGIATLQQTRQYIQSTISQGCNVHILVLLRQWNNACYSKK